MLCQPHSLGCLALWVVLIGAGFGGWYFFFR
jgi:hypothetical protein